MANTFYCVVERRRTLAGGDIRIPSQFVYFLAAAEVGI